MCDEISLLDVIKRRKIDGREETELINLDEPVVWCKIDDMGQDLSNREGVVTSEEGQKFSESLACKRTDDCV